MKTNQKNAEGSAAEPSTKTGQKLQKKERELVRRGGKLLFLLLVLFFLFRYFYTNFDRIRSLEIRPEPGTLALSVLLYFVYKVTQASLWHYITVLDHASIRYRDAVTAFLYSLLGRYIPGKVFLLAARFPAYDRANVPLRRVTVCFLLENICTLLGAAFLFLLSLFFFPDNLLKGYRGLTVLLVIAFFICLHPSVINFFLGILEKVTGKEGMKIPFTYRQMLRIVILFILNWLVAGTAFYLMVSSFYPVPLSRMMYTAGVYGLSVVAGLLALFAPSGIGVREGLLVLGLSVIMPQEMAVIISIAARLWATVAEVILVGATFLFDKIRGERKKNANH